MATVDRNTLKNWFVKGAKPTAAQFAELIDSLFHKKDNIPANQVAGLQEALDQKAEKEAYNVTAKLVGELRTDFNSATNSMNTAAAAAYDAQRVAGEAAQQAQAATQAATTATAAAREEIIIMEALRQQLVISAALVPTIMELSYPASVSIRNSGSPRIVARLLPVYALQNVLFLAAGGDALMVLPDGRIVPNRTGTASVHVIPANATHLYKTVQVTIRNPYLRKVSGGGLRITSSGRLRII
jgi:hypothetical protein